MSSADIRYTLCFLTHEEAVLMLHRRNPPNQGLWNGVGGHIEDGETPTASCLREVYEETGYALQAIRFAGLLTWRGFEISDGGLYLFTAPVQSTDFKPSSEGTLAWKPFHFVFTSPMVVSNIHVFGPQILNGAPPQVYHFEYNGGEILEHEIYPLSSGIQV
ncbi:MAG: NUDIX domain-containing protein [Anaerolineaceae bacterium]|nr:NUDIX domain-containing protein [Anaerolineaceae bacterium]